MLKFMSFSSGSCGNCYYIGTDSGGLLVDAGVSLRRVRKCMEENGLSMDDVAGILVTHDHLDHIRHLGSFCKRLHKPVYTTPVLHRALSVHTFTSQVISGCRHDAPENAWTRIGDFTVRPFVVPHDATQTVGYAIRSSDTNLVIMTDIGRMTDEAVGFASEASAVIVESNYDIDMLMGGPYTYELKMRIVQGCGHLSNDECASAIRRFYHDGLRHVFLCHLSENNNTADLAYASALAALKEAGAEAGEVSLRCLPRTHPSPLFIL